MFSNKENITFVEFFFIVLFVLFFSLLMLWSADKVFGATYSQTDESTTFNDTTYPGIRLGKGFSGALNKIKLRASATSCIRYFYYVRGYSDSGYSDLIQTITGYPDEWNSVTTPNDENWGNEVKSFSYGDVTLNFNGETLDPDTYYQIWGNSDCGDSSRSMGFKGKTGAGADEGWRTDDQSWQMGQIPYYIINPVTVSNSIDVTFPTSTTTQDFTDFKISYEIDTTTDDARTFYIDWGTSTSTWQHTDYVNEIPIPPTNSETGIDVPKGSTVPIGQTYYAQARLEMGGVNIATSSIISWTPTSSWIYQNFYEDIPTSTASSTDWNITCDPDSNVFVNSLCKIAVYLFVPNNDALDKFTNLKDAIINKPPVGYFYSIKTAISSISTSTAPISIDFGNTSATSSPFYIFKTGMNWILWFIFGFWVLNRFRHFDL